MDNPKVLLTTSLWKLWGSKASYDPGYGDHLLLLARAKLRDGATFPCMGQLVHQLPAIPLYLEYLRKFPQRLRPLLAKMLYRSYVTLAFFAPAAPEPGNRLVLSSRRDRYGVPQVDVRYQESGQELAMQEVMLALGRKLLRKASATLFSEKRLSRVWGFIMPAPAGCLPQPARVVDWTLGPLTIPISSSATAALSGAAGKTFDPDHHGPGPSFGRALSRCAAPVGGKRPSEEDRINVYVFIACYNNVELLKKTLAGLCRNQGGAAFEVILVDNNSFDEDINTAYEKYVRFLDLVCCASPVGSPESHQPGPNLGLRLSRYEWVINLDADCPLPSYLAILLSI